MVLWDHIQIKSYFCSCFGAHPDVSIKSLLVLNGGGGGSPEIGRLGAGDSASQLDADGSCITLLGVCWLSILLVCLSGLRGITSLITCH